MISLPKNTIAALLAVTSLAACGGSGSGSGIGSGSSDDTPAHNDGGEGTATDDPAPGSTLEPLTACEPDLIYTVADMNSGVRIQDALGLVPEGGALGIESGEYNFPTRFQAFMTQEGKFRDKRICGIGDSRPHLKSPKPTKWNFGDNNDIIIDGIELEGISIYIPGGEHGDQFHELRLHNMRIEQTGGRCLFVGYGPQLDPKERPGKAGDDPLETSYITLTDTQFSDCTGPDNHRTHSMYLSRRGCVMRADSVHVEHMDGLEAFRSLCRVNVVTNSFFTNVVKNSDGSLKTNTLGSKFGATSIDFPSCSAYILRDNTFDIYGNGTLAAIGARSRISMTACDMPNWTPESEGKMHWDPLFWSAVREKSITDPANPHTFPVVMVNNVFRFTSLGSNNNSRVISGWGTYPRRHTDPMTSSANLDWLAVPDGWIERNVVFSHNNTFEGEWNTIHKLNLFQNDADTSDPDAVYPPPPVKFVEVQDLSTLPLTCTDLEAQKQWWDEPGDHTGFPPCP